MSIEAKGSYEDIDNLFISLFPLGLQDKKWLDLGKRHQNAYLRLVDLFKQELSKQNIEDHLEKGDYKYIAEQATKVIQKSTMVSLFEKIAFRNFIEQTSIHRDFADSLYALLYNDYKKNFAQFVGVLGSLKDYKNANAAKWTVVSAFLCHSNPYEHVFIKPTTVKNIALFLGIDISYNSSPNIETYEKVRNMILDYKKVSKIAKEQDNIIAQAIMYVGLAI
jgi:hypothetical protein